MYSLVKKFFYYCFSPRALLSVLIYKYGGWLPDKFYVAARYYLIFGRFLNLKNPKTYNQKIQWLKLYDQRALYTELVDKVLVKKWVANLIGENHVIPTIATYRRAEDIDFDCLPEKFVLKCNHDSGIVLVCKNKALLDRKKVVRDFSAALNRDYFARSREWPYKNVKRRILVECYMEDSATKELRDYKFFCFDGVPKILFVATDRFTKGVETKFDFFDMNYEHLPFTNGHPNADVLPEKPMCFEQMKSFAKILSKGFPHVRVDFYEIDGKVYFGEMTFYHWSGLVPFVPEKWDYILGEWIKLPKE